MFTSYSTSTYITIPNPFPLRGQYGDSTNHCRGIFGNATRCGLKVGYKH